MPIRIMGTCLEAGRFDLMKKKSLSFVLGVSALAVVALSGWVPARIADEDKTMPAGDIRQVLSDMGAKVEEKKDEEGKTYFLVATKDGNGFLLFQYGGKGDLCTSISVSAPFEMEPKLEKLDKWNSETRYTKAYSAGEKTVVLEADLDVSVAPSKAVVQKFLTTFSKAVTAFKDK